MQEFIWINGDISPLAEATINVEDRGFQFADGVYEVIRVYNGRCFALDPHLDRLERSAAGIKINLPHSKAQLGDEINKLIQQSKLDDGIVYMQLTRGVCRRNHLFPDQCAPTMLFYTRGGIPIVNTRKDGGISIQSIEDIRWKMCWVKSIALLPNVLAKNEAAAAGADEAVFISDGIVTECCTSNIFFVAGGRLITHPVGAKVLAGITRSIVIDCAKELQVRVDELPLTEAEAIAADEIFITSTAREINWVSRWNGRDVGIGGCGPITEQLHHAMKRRIDAQTRQTVSL